MSKSAPHNGNNPSVIITSEALGGVFRFTWDQESELIHVTSQEHGLNNEPICRNGKTGTAYLLSAKTAAEFKKRCRSWYKRKWDRESV